MAVTIIKKPKEVKSAAENLEILKKSDKCETFKGFSVVSGCARAKNPNHSRTLST
jgi:hypothetical protein